MDGAFTRISPAAFADKVGIPIGWVVLSHRWVPSKAERRRSTGRWFRIESEKGAVYRIVRFSPNLAGSPEQESGQLVIDWSAWLRLSGFEENTKGPLDLKFRKSGWWAFPCWVLTHPDPTIVLSGVISLISLGLGFMSLLLAIAALD